MDMPSFEVDSYLQVLMGIMKGPSITITTVWNVGSPECEVETLAFGSMF
jgi:hypothetical protein